MDSQQARDTRRTILYVMVFRVALATLLLGAVVLVALTSRSPERLDGPFGRFVLKLIAAAYLASLFYGVLLRRVRNTLGFAYVQVGVDLVLISILVHATGGADSGYGFLYLIDIIAMALLPSRNGVLVVALAAACSSLGVCLAGWWEWLPPVPGQTVFPWDLTQRELMQRLVVTQAGVASVGALGYALAAQSKQAGERLVRHERLAGDLASLHENIIRSLSSGLVTTNRDGLVTSINDAAAEILGIAPAQALGQPVAQHLPAIATLLAEVGPVGSVRRREIEATRLDGAPRQLGVSATPLTDHAGQIIGRVIHFQDLTDLRRMELAVRRSERLAGIGRLAAGVAHEIRNPLASISGSVELLRMLTPQDPDTQSLAQIVFREVDRLNQLITSLLDYTRPPGELREAIDLSELVRECVRAFQQGRPRSQVITDAVTPDLRVHGGDGPLRQVLWNLLRNADEAAAPERPGRIEVALAPAMLGDTPAAMLSVRDQGVGIPPEHLDHIFEPFFTQGKASGTGLGLALVARVVEDHRGTIEVDSTPGAGTIFVIRLPLAAAPLAR